VRKFSPASALQAIPWFAEDEYDRARSLMTDVGHLPTDYKTWRRSAEAEEHRLRSGNMNPVRIVIVPANFVAWCSERGIALDAESRSRYAREAFGSGAVITRWPIQDD
jgi:hypothetical protein